MNNNEKIATGAVVRINNEVNPVLVKRAQIEEYKARYQDLITKAFSPGGFSAMGAACEAEFVLSTIFHVSQDEITAMMTEGMKKSNESKTNS